MNEEEKKRLYDGFHNLKSSFEREQARMKKSGDKKNGCIWLQDKFSYAGAWMIGFVSGVLTAIKMDD